MNIATFTRESSRNRHAYQQLRETIQRDHFDQYVTLANGRLIGAAGSFDAARDLVGQLDPVPEYYLVFRGSAEPDFDLVYDLAGSV